MKLKPIPWYIKLRLWFVKPQYTYDFESCGLDQGDKKDYSVLITYKRLSGVTYIFSQEIL